MISNSASGSGTTKCRCAATGIAASALTFGLLANGALKSRTLPVTVNQGRAMKRPSRISVRLNLEGGEVTGCGLGGEVRLENSAQH